LQFLGYRTERLFEDRNDPLSCELLTFCLPTIRSEQDPKRLRSNIADTQQCANKKGYRVCRSRWHVKLQLPQPSLKETALAFVAHQSERALVASCGIG
jgi:hypothetical protein